MTAIGRGFVATLSTDVRGPIERKPAASWGQAFAKARLLLDAAERRQWNQGESCRSASRRRTSEPGLLAQRLILRHIDHRTHLSVFVLVVALPEIGAATETGSSDITFRNASGT
jgi:hypothetical protein